MKVQVGEEIKANPASGTGKETKKPLVGKKIVVDNSMSESDLLKLDAEGAELLFDPKENFLRLDDGIVSQLSRVAKASYHQARVFNDTYKGKEDQAFTERFKVDKEFSGTAQDKLEDIKVRSGLKHTWVTPALMSTFLKKGYREAGPDDAKTFLGTTGGHHEIVRDGKTELVLMVIPEELDKRNTKLKNEQDLAILNSSDAQGLAAIEQSGARGFIDKSTKSDSEYEDLEAEGF